VVQDRDAELSQSRERVARDNNEPSDKAHVLIGFRNPWDRRARLR
jgi:hypothetical protein